MSKEEEKKQIDQKAQARISENIKDFNMNEQILQELEKELFYL